MARSWRQGEVSGFAFITAGAVVVGASLGGYLVGLLIDRALGIGPRYAIVGLILGTIIGFWDLYQLATRMLKQQMSTPIAPSESDDNFSDDDEGVRDINHESEE